MSYTQELLTWRTGRGPVSWWRQCVLKACLLPSLLDALATVSWIFGTPKFNISSFWSVYVFNFFIAPFRERHPYVLHRLLANFYSDSVTFPVGAVTGAGVHKAPKTRKSAQLLHYHRTNAFFWWKTVATWNTKLWRHRRIHGIRSRIFSDNQAYEIKKKKTQPSHQLLEKLR